MENQFKRGMRRLAGAVTIITAGTGETISGLTATAVCSLTARPPRLLACLNEAGITFETLRRHGRFCINVLGKADQAVAEAFAGMTGLEGAARFSVGEWAIEGDAPPRLLTAECSFDCAVYSVTLLATHGLVIGDVRDVHISAPQVPLIYHDGQFTTVS